MLAEPKAASGKQPGQEEFKEIDPAEIEAAAAAVAKQFPQATSKPTRFLTTTPSHETLVQKPPSTMPPPPKGRGGPAKVPPAPPAAVA